MIVLLLHRLSSCSQLTPAHLVVLLMQHRQRQRLILLHKMDGADLAPFKGQYTVTSPLPNHAAARNWLLECYNPQLFELLQLSYPAVPPVVEQAWANELPADDPTLVLGVQEALEGWANADARYMGLSKSFQQLSASLISASAADWPALRAQLVELFATATASVNTSSSSSSRDAARMMSMLWPLAAGVGTMGAKALIKPNSWFDYAVRQLHIRDAASSDAAAQLLLGPNPIEPEHLM
jgi:hypothetical protein